MRTTFSFGIALLLLSTACQKDDIVEAVTGERPACGTDGARVSATIDGSDWCADALVHAVMEDSSAMVSAVNLNSSSLSFSIDRTEVGTTPIVGDANGVIYLEGGVTYIVPEGVVGQLQITTCNVTAGRLCGTLDVELHSVVGDQQRNVHIAFDVTASAEPG